MIGWAVDRSVTGCRVIGWWLGMFWLSAEQGYVSVCLTQGRQQEGGDQHALPFEVEERQDTNPVGCRSGSSPCMQAVDRICHVWLSDVIWCALQGHVDIVKLLLESGGDIKTDTDPQPLAAAAQWGDDMTI